MIEKLSAANPLVLASGSPRRRELLARAGIPFVVDVPSIAEDNPTGLVPVNFTRKLAAEKAQAVLSNHPGKCILGADTAVVLDGKIYGKPNDAADAMRILGELLGHKHVVITAVALLVPGRIPDIRQEQTQVTMRLLSKREMEEYIASGEPLDKAGAYAIQDKGSLIVKKVIGDFYTVVGLPLVLVQRMLIKAKVW